ncbi:membrane hypothetical protein [Vibrio nigripulchritudo MADA3029]|uniref:hypothetical protein n=1 Tax=Vibrio nigripulchritudo TaxID=28173 RepID=UPI0003B17CD7|nr:hypothetical protein [Vibrio nigripulchritudo]CCN49187.1 membrane hypothetical protein [Vibrio nigripulchritudo MADA3020]CCN54172.1 membrane hypothetical protein [Vibrio nigripulchritudo MADA3021]CCN61242.1 membrane hypothetical protein [Vibrio nigripulchritudo MADA3029]
MISYDKFRGITLLPAYLFGAVMCFYSLNQVFYKEYEILAIIMFVFNTMLLTLIRVHCFNVVNEKHVDKLDNYSVIFKLIVSIHLFSSFFYGDWAGYKLTAFGVIYSLLLLIPYETINIKAIKHKAMSSNANPYVVSGVVGFSILCISVIGALLFMQNFAEKLPQYEKNTEIQTDLLTLEEFKERQKGGQNE